MAETQKETNEMEAWETENDSAPLSGVALKEARKNTTDTLDEDKKLLNRAVEFAYKHSQDGYMCPICGVQKGIEDNNRKGKNTALINHIRGSHPDRVIAWFMHPELGVDAMTDIMRQMDENDGVLPIAENPGFDNMELVDSHEAFDFNFVPAAIKQDAERRNLYLRWVPKANVQKRSYQGYIPYERPKGSQMPHQASHEDSTTQSNERILMAIPKMKRDAYLQHMTRERRERRQTLYPSLESQGKTLLSDPGKNAYDHWTGRGMNHENAMKMARQAERKAADQPGRRVVVRTPGYEQ